VQSVSTAIQPQSRRHHLIVINAVEIVAPIITDLRPRC